MPGRPEVEICTDDELGYVSGRTSFKTGQPFRLDEPYRLAHLPLVAPDHVDVIATKNGTTYGRGRHERVASLVLPVPEQVHDCAASKELEAELRGSPLQRKISWTTFDQRRKRLHATICPSLAHGDARPDISIAQRDALTTLGPMTVEVRGLFSGTHNHGRLYLRLYPEKREQQNSIHLIQRLLGRPQTDSYLVGLFNLTDHLSANEARFFAALLDRWWDRLFLRFSVEYLWLLAAYDDLVLDAAVEEVLPLS